MISLSPRAPGTFEQCHNNIKPRSSQTGKAPEVILFPISQSAEAIKGACPPIDFDLNEGHKLISRAGKDRISMELNLNAP